MKLKSCMVILNLCATRRKSRVISMLGEMTKISEIVEARVLIRSSNYTFEVFKYFIPCLVGSVELHDQRTNKAMIR